MQMKLLIIVAAAAMPCAAHATEFAKKGSNALVGDVKFGYASNAHGGGDAETTTDLEFAVTPTFFRFVVDGLAIGAGIGAAVTNEQTGDTNTSASAGVVGGGVAYFHRLGNEVPVFGVVNLAGEYAFIGSVERSSSNEKKPAYWGDVSMYGVSLGFGVTYAGVGEWGPLVSMGIEVYHRQTEIDLAQTFKLPNVTTTGAALSTGIGVFF